MTSNELTPTEAEAVAFLDGLYAVSDIDDEYAAHHWRIRQRDRQRANGDYAETVALARRLAALPPATTPAGWPPFEDEQA